MPDQRKPLLPYNTIQLPFSVSLNVGDVFVVFVQFGERFRQQRGKSESGPSVASVDSQVTVGLGDRYVAAFAPLSNLFAYVGT